MKKKYLSSKHYIQLKDKCIEISLCNLSIWWMTQNVLTGKSVNGCNYLQINIGPKWLSIVCADVTHVTLVWIIDDVGVDGVASAVSPAHPRHRTSGHVNCHQDNEKYPVNCSHPSVSCNHKYAEVSIHVLTLNVVFRVCLVPKFTEGMWS